MHLFPECYVLRVNFLICRALIHDTGFLEAGNDHMHLNLLPT